MTTIIIKARYYGYAYIATGQGLQASSTNSEEVAVETLVKKLIARDGGERQALYNTAPGQWVFELHHPPLEIPPRRHRVQVDVANLSDAGYELLTRVITLLTDDAHERARNKVLSGEWALHVESGDVEFTPSWRREVAA